MNIRQARKRGALGRGTAVPRMLRAGVAKSEITTSAKGAVIRDPLYAKALVLDDGRTRVAIVSMDTTAIGGRRNSQRILDDVGESFLPKLRDRVEKKLNIPGGNVLVNASHTHPPGRLLCSDHEQLERVFDAVRRATEGMMAVRIGAGSGKEDRITINRTLRLKSGKHWTIRHSHPCPPDDEVDGIGPMDPEIGILRLDRLDGRPLAVVYNFACHFLFGDARGSVTANIPGIASRVIEEGLGNGAMALFLQGAAGDIVDVLFKEFHQPRDIEPLGTMLGMSTLKALRNIRTNDASLGVISETLELPRRTDILERLAALRKNQAELLESLKSTSLNFKSFLPLYLRYALSPAQPLGDSYRYLQAKETGSDEFAAMDIFNRKQIEKYLKNMGAMEKLVRIQEDLATFQKHQAVNEESGAATIAAEVQGIRIGSCVLITAPIELLAEVGLYIKRVSHYRPTLVAAFSNGYLHYGPPASDYNKGGYEVTECLLAPEWEKRFQKAVKDILRRL